LRNYELVLVINPEIADENVGAVTERVSQWIAASGGELVNTNPWGRRRLAYPIKDQREGNYIVTQVRMAPKATAELERNLSISDDVLRHLLVRQEE
jgi:small subunit ribosomal protein S6